MPGFKNLRRFVEAEVETGSYSYSSFRKSPTQATVAGAWFDMALSPGNPSPFYYASAPLTAVTMSASDGGIRHGRQVSPSKQFLRKLLVMNTAMSGNCVFRLLDYLLYYPFVDESTNDAQDMDNTVTLSRYTDGKGVMIMPIVVAAHATGGATFTCTYTNQSGVAGRVTPAATLNTVQFVTGTVASTNTVTPSANPFMALQTGDTGVRSIEQVTFTSGSDVGLLTFVLVKPLANLVLTGGTAANSSFMVEYDYMTMAGMGAPEIADNAYLNLVVNSTLSLSGQSFHGEIHTTWG